MDTDSVDTFGTQYIICECGDNFQDEKLLNIHLANGHAELETFQCDSCPEIFTSEELYQQHSNEHKAKKQQRKLPASDPKAKTKVTTTPIAVKGCPEIFTSEELYQQHSNGHKAEKQQRKLPASDPKLKTKVTTTPIAVKKGIFISEKVLERHKNEHKARKLQKKETNTESSFRDAAEIEAPEASQASHTAQAGKHKTPTSHEVKTYSKENPSQTVLTKPVLKTPIIKVNSLKRIDSISLIQNLQEYGNLIKIHSSLALASQQEQVPEAMESVTVEPVIVKSETVQDDVNEEIYYQCDVCNTIFYTEADFDVHYQSTHAMKVEVTPEEILEEHLVSDHIDDVNVKAEMETVETAYYFECEMCHKIFASEEYFNIHYNKAHGGLLTVTEPLQEQAEQNQEELTEENQTEDNQDYAVDDYKEEIVETPKAPEQVIYFKCDLCKVLYPSEEAYNSHFSRKHGGGAGFRYIEQDLSGEYPRPSPSTDEYCCEFCPKAFAVQRSLQVHRRRVHAGRLPRAAPAPAPAAARAPSRSKVCDVCGRAYNSNAALRYHQRRHTGEKPYPCTYCSKRFTMPMFLQIHLRTHTGEKPFECPLCPKAFTNKAALIRHNRVHTGEKPYPCPTCGKFFTQSNSMKLHVSTVHLKLPAPYKSKNRRNKSEARALQLALKGIHTEIVEEVEEHIVDE